ncbi:hypothetical protein FQN53_002235 [Emmonsiellopsis sp. PD_33]|nr:hypothetical protein FQN53_002235 [Emmonsiellopsis sp. PD_33]
MDRNSSLYPYEPGRTISFQVGRETGPTTTSATIIQLLEADLSCTMLVEVKDAGLNGQFVLKLFDRRFASGVRKHCEAPAWNLDIEDKYRQFVRDGDAFSLLKFCSETDDEDIRCDYLDDWNEQQREAYVQHFCLKFYNSETEVYRRLHQVQGIDIPRLFAKVCMPSHSNRSVAEEELISCPGVLLEYIRGFSLSDLPEFAHRESWQWICDDAIRIVNDIGDHDIRNEDVKPRNCIVRKWKDSNGATHFKPVMIDFAQCVFRKEGQDDNDWRFWKAIVDEEGAIGVVMHGKARRLGGGYHYEQSAQSLQLHKDFKSEGS